MYIIYVYKCCVDRWFQKKQKAGSFLLQHYFLLAGMVKNHCSIAYAHLSYFIANFTFVKISYNLNLFIIYIQVITWGSLIYTLSPRITYPNNKNKNSNAAINSLFQEVFIFQLIDTYFLFHISIMFPCIEILHLKSRSKPATILLGFGGGGGGTCLDDK